MSAQPLSLKGRIEGANAATLTPQVAAAAASQGFKVAAPVPGMLTLSRSFRPPWVGVVVLLMVVLSIGSAVGGAAPATIIWVLIAVAVVVFARTTETVSLVITDGAGAVDVTATGTAADSMHAFVTGLVPEWGGADSAVEVPSAQPAPSRRVMVGFGAVVAVVLVAGASYAALANRGDDAVAAIERSQGGAANMHCDAHKGMTFSYGKRTVYRCGDSPVGPCFTVSNGFVNRVDDFKEAKEIGCSPRA